MPTIIHRLVRWSQEQPQAIAQTFKREGRWVPITAREMLERARSLAGFFEERGFRRQECGVIFSANCPEWVHTDLAVQSLGGLSAGVYPNSTYEDLKYILNNTQARFIAVQNKQFFDRLTGPSGESALPSTVESILVFEGEADFHPKAIRYEDALKRGASRVAGRDPRPDLDRINPAEGAILIFTSGTTGNPKGAVLSHSGFSYMSDIIIKNWGLDRISESSLDMFSFLPLCHIAERLQAVGVGISGRFKINFCSKFERVAQEIVEIQPVVLLCVPRLWEKMMEGVEHKVQSAPAVRKRLARWALELGVKRSQSIYHKGEWGLSDALSFKLADRLVISKVKRALGLSRIAIAASGAAALPAHVSRWFKGLGIEIQDCYAQTECSGPVTMTVPGEESSGTVGRPVGHGAELKIAEDGEILLKGPHVFLGYFRNEEATRATIVDGWLHTGDLAAFNDAGQLVIKGRKKEILKTSGGKMVAPLPIEEKITASPLVSQACVVGDGRKYLVALLTLEEGLRKRLVESQASQSNGAGVLHDTETENEIQFHLNQLNAGLGSYEQIKYFTILAREFSVESGELTPTMKMKRNVIESRYKDLIDKMY